jgi:hypothetical protein
VNNSNDLRKCDAELGKKFKQSTDIDELMPKFISIINVTFMKHSGNQDPEIAIPKALMWTIEFTIFRK